MRMAHLQQLRIVLGELLRARTQQDGLPVQHRVAHVEDLHEGLVTGKVQERAAAVPGAAQTDGSPAPAHTTVIITRAWRHKQQASM